MQVGAWIRKGAFWSRSSLIFCAAIVLSLGVLPSSGRAADQVVERQGRYAKAIRQLDAWLSAEIAAKALPALSIAMVDGEQVVWAHGFGFTDLEKRTKATAETVYRVGSVSKLFTDLAVMQLVEQGRLDLDAPIDRILPEFAPRNPYKVPITLRQLMSHRSGLVREPPVGHYFDASPPSLEDVVKSLARTTLVFEPGTRTKYSNAGVAVVGAVVARVKGEPFSKSIDHALFQPLGMSRSSFEPGPELAKSMAHGIMWSYDGRSVPTPEFLLGTGPAGNMVSTVLDLSRFLSFLFADGRGPGGSLLKPETVRSMIEPQLGKPGETPGFGLGFRLSKLDQERRIGHGGAVYGFATNLEALPDAKLGAVVIAAADCANGFTEHAALTAIKLMLAVRRGTPLPVLESSKPIGHDQASALQGRYTQGDKIINLTQSDGKLYLSPFQGALRVEIRSLGEMLIVDDRLAYGPIIRPSVRRIAIGDELYYRLAPEVPQPCPVHWTGLIGEYGWDHDVLYILEKEGRLHALIEWFFDYPLKEEQPDHFRFPDYGLYPGEEVVFRRDQTGQATVATAAGVTFPRRHLDGEDGKTFRIQPRRPVELLRAEAERASPPVEPAGLRTPELVELATIEPTLHFDVRYATTNNFLGVPLYTEPRAFLQKPAAEALARVHRTLAKQGFGLLIHDAYRPWSVTRMFWDAVPDSGRSFVADPLKGSKHNRGSAVDLTLYKRQTGEPVRMVGGYDEFSPRSFPDYPGGTSLERWHRDLLRQAMEAEDFTVNEFEWWHFDHGDWAKYPILNRRFEDVAKIGLAK
jgi:CubicO group peptidase (beta-lactamase class C family)/D-alanyl-D-alanine dipeptidase